MTKQMNHISAPRYPRSLRQEVLMMAALSSMFPSAFGATNHKYFVDQSGQAIDWVCVIASYSKVTGVGIGPDGKGRTGSKESFLLKPFKYVSSENFSGTLLSGGGFFIPIPPFVAMGETHYNQQLLFLRPGYQPLPLGGRYHHRTETLTMKSDTTKRAEAVFDALLKRDARSPLLVQYFVLETGKESGELVIDYTAEDDELLRSCLVGNPGAK